MYKAPVGRVATLQDALAPELRNLPMIEPSPGVSEALVQKLGEMSANRAQAKRRHVNRTQRSRKP